MMETQSIPSEPTSSRCLICYCELPDLQMKIEPQFPDLDQEVISNSTFCTVFGEFPLLSKQLYAFFLLRNVLELSPKQLEVTLRDEGSLETWVKLCEQCNNEIEDVQQNYFELQLVSNKYNEDKWKIQEKIRNSVVEFSSSPSRSWRDTRVEIGNAVDQCRDIVCKRKWRRRKAPIFHSSISTIHGVHPFIKGEQSAEELFLRDQNQNGEVTFKFDSSRDEHFENVDVDEGGKVEMEEKVQTNGLTSLERDPLLDDNIKMEVNYEGGMADISQSAFLENYEDSSPSPPSLSESDSSSCLTKLPKTKTSRKSVVLRKKVKHSTRGAIGTKRIYCEHEGCTKSYTSRKTYEGHLIWHQGKPAPYKCAFCKLSFWNDGGLYRHELRVHKIVIPETGESLWRCLNCNCSDQLFREKSMLEEHHKACVKVSEEEEKGKKELEFQSLHCEICNTQFKDKCDLQAHRTFKHPDIAEFDSKIIGGGGTEDEEDSSSKSLPRIPCKLCDKTFQEERSLQRHITRKHGGSSRFQCSLCGIYEIYNSSLHLHKARQHGIDVERYRCPSCLKMNWSTSENKRRRCCSTSTSKLVEKLSTCPICGKEFKSPGQRSTHIRMVHEKVTEQFCELCGKSYCKKQALTKHMAEVHKIGEFKCEEEGCDKVFEYKILLENHVKYKHKGELVPLRHMCTFCGKGFSRPSKLTEHMNAVHINKESKPFKCTKCEKCFASEGTLKGHLRNVHEKRRKSKAKSLN